MKNKVLLAGIALLFIGCVTKPQKTARNLIQQQQIDKNSPQYVITDYKNKDSGGTIPKWIQIYLESGIPGLEALDTFEGNYIFIGENSSTNYDALEQWMAGFSVTHDFPRLVSARIESRFLRSALTYPDDEYGSYYEAMVKAASDSFYDGVFKNDEFWIKRLYYDDMGKGDREVYEFYIIISIIKPILEEEITSILSHIEAKPAPSKDQVHAIDRVRNNFFNGF